MNNVFTYIGYFSVGFIIIMIFGKLIDICDQFVTMKEYIMQSKKDISELRFYVNKHQENLTSLNADINVLIMHDKDWAK